MRSLRNRTHVRGFTLIELLVALTILTVLMAVVYQGLSVALAMWDKAGRRAEAIEEEQTSILILRDQIRGALPLVQIVGAAGGSEGAQPRLAFMGSSRALRFVSAVSWRDGAHAAPQWIEWEGTDARMSIVERAILSPSNAPGSRENWHSEITVLEDFQLRYLRRAQTDRPAEWLNAWDPAELRELPAAVEVRYKLRGQSLAATVPLDYADANWKGYQVQ